MEKRVEKRRFQLSEFREEAEWLAAMQKQGWKFVSTDGRSYEFASCKKEEWSYQLDFKEDGAVDADYIQLFYDYGWEYVFHYGKWFYFRKKKVEGEENDVSIFSDNESKAEMCKRVMNGQFLRIIPLYLIMLAYDYFTFFTDVFRGDTFWNGLAQGIGIGLMLVVAFGFGVFIREYLKLNTMLKSFQQLEK
ncbi:MAG: DUF2812 domain-containing protein [Lachnospiraceae bacterium]|nr:DUF2812 domain-containing protein [Lachnospiraceae bacterium]